MVHKYLLKIARIMVGGTVDNSRLVSLMATQKLNIIWSDIDNWGVNDLLF
jgi:hypothetical protein